MEPLLLLAILHINASLYFQTYGRIEQMSYNGTLLGIASDDSCGYLLNNMSLVFKFCSNISRPCAPPAMSGVGSYGSTFVFTNFNGYAYVLKGGTVKKFWVGTFKGKVVALKNFFVSCYVGCAAFTYSGKKLWEYDTIFAGTPSTNGKVIFVPEITKKRITVLSLNGTVLKSLPTGENEAMSTSYCGGLLAVGTSTSIIVLNATTLETLWKSDISGRAWSVAFSPNCKYLAVADSMGGVVRIYTTNGEELGSLKVLLPYSVYWGPKYLYVGTEVGKLIAIPWSSS